ncbi:MAG: KH domain-containing protein [Syntrophaceae bacterium]
MKDLIRIMAKSLVDKPEQVNVKEITGEQAMIFELRVSKDDVGKIIGKQGATVKAMRTILSAASAKNRRRSTLEIIE